MRFDVVVSGSMEFFGRLTHPFCASRTENSPACRKTYSDGVNVYDRSRLVSGAFRSQQIGNSDRCDDQNNGDYDEKSNERENRCIASGEFVRGCGSFAFAASAFAIVVPARWYQTLRSGP
jgi:hypothetical protein